MKQKEGGERQADSSRVSRRSLLDIRMGILRAILEGAKRPAQIMYKANLSWLVLTDQLSALDKEGFIGEKTRNSRTDYFLTEKGVGVIGDYLNLTRMFDSEFSDDTKEGVAVSGGKHQQSLAESQHLREAFGVDGRRALVVARMINLERHKENA
jgi:predicted transcriptional regulator